MRAVTRDRTERAAAGLYNSCYVNAFQTQPGQATWWKTHHPRLLLREGGELVQDPGWPGEILLDTSTRRKRGGIAAIVGGWIAGCGRSGFQAVEPDNLDSFTRSRHLLSRTDNLALARLLGRQAHAHRLAFAQKNLAGVTSRERERAGFDFAVAEECQVYSECRAYTSIYGRHVIEIEYDDNGIRAFRRACNLRGDAKSVVFRDRQLRRPSHRQYEYAAC